MSAKKMPKGGRKGGTTFPRVRLKDAAGYAEKLVSKTHTGTQPDTVILPGVFGASGPSGKVRASALKQFGLLEGTPKAYDSTELAQSIVAAPEEEIRSHLATAFFKVKVFTTLFDTFCDDTVSTARVRQQALKLKVHPDSVNECVELFIGSATDAGLANQSGDDIAFTKTPVEKVSEDQAEAETEEQSEVPPEEEQTEVVDAELEQEPETGGQSSVTPSKTKANLEIKIDPSMDPEKLDRLLGVLKKYGQI
ncbi:MAG: hypothetical protein SynsKO_30370 [Synoicihabitans sp.]